MLYVEVTLNFVGETSSFYSFICSYGDYSIWLSLDIFKGKVFYDICLWFCLNPMSVYWSAFLSLWLLNY